MSLKQLVLEVEGEFPNYRNVDLRRAYNEVILRGGDWFSKMLRSLKSRNYMAVVPENEEFYQVRTSVHTSHFFSKNPEYWKKLRRDATTQRAVTRSPLNMLKLHYKTVSCEDYDDDDKQLATQLMAAAKFVYGKSPEITCVMQCIKHLVGDNQGHTDACAKQNPDIVLQKFLCRIGFDGWIRLHNVKTLTQDFREIEHHEIDEIMVCDLDNMEFQ